MKQIYYAILVLGSLVAMVRPAFATNADIELTGKLRFYYAQGITAVQVDVLNDSNHHPAFGPSVELEIENVGTFYGALYQYYGGTATAPNTVNPKQLGYVPVKIAGNVFQNGQTVYVKVHGRGE